MKYPIKESEMMKAVKKHLEDDSMQFRKCDKQFVRAITRALNQAYISGVKDGMNR